MQLRPLKKYEKPGYPQLCTVEEKIHLSVVSGKKAATLAMVIASALSLTTCSTVQKTSSVQITGSSRDSQLNSSGNITTQGTADLTHIIDEGIQTYVTTAGIALVEETMETSQTALAGDILSTDESGCEPSITDRTAATDETAYTTYGPEVAGSIIAPGDTAYTAVD